jgi:hypothetical protein
VYFAFSRGQLQFRFKWLVAFWARIQQWMQLQPNYDHESKGPEVSLHFRPCHFNKEQTPLET